MAKFKEIKNFVLNPIKENRKNRRVRDNAYYLNQIRSAEIKEDSILLESYHGVSFTGNSYAIFRQMLHEYPKLSYYIAVKNIEDPMVKWIEKNYKSNNIEIVKYESKRYLQLLATCKYLINDTSFMPYFTKRKEQIYVNTWHGTPLKTLGTDIKKTGFNSHKNIQKNLFTTDKLIMPNEFTAQKLIESHDISGILNAEVGIYGNPRVDLTLNSSKQEILKKYQLITDKKIVLYAPTWKKSLKETTAEDIQQLILEVELLQTAFGSDYHVYLKSHYFIYNKLVELGIEEKVVPNWIDTNELLCCVDCLITDYSSVFFDFLPLKRPIYFYMPDKDVYEEERGFYLDIETLPGKVSYNLDDLLEAVKQDKEEYINFHSNKINNYLETYCYGDNGKSAAKAVDFILGNRSESYLFKSNKKVIVFYGGGFYNNGITNSIINLSKMIDYEKYEIILVENDKVFKEKVNNMERLDKRVHVISKFSRTNRNVMDTISQNLLYRQGFDSKYINKESVKKFFQLDFQRIFGNLNPDVMIDYGGYNKMFTAIFAFSPVKKKAIFLHNDMMGEYNKVINGRYKHRWNLKVTFSLYDQFDKLVSVTESSNEINKQNLGHLISDKENKMISISNIINGDEIKDMAEEGLNNKYFDKATNQEYLIYQKEEIGDYKLTLRTIKSPNENYTNFVNIARLSPEKNHEELITAFKEVVKKDSMSRLYILGDGPLKKHLSSLVKELNLENHVFLLGFINNPFMFINNCDCFILPSVYEGQGMVILEAQVLGLPVIGTNVPGINSIINDNNGLLVEKDVDSIAQGMIEYLDKGIVQEPLDYNEYNKQILSKLYNEVLES